MAKNLRRLRGDSLWQGSDSKSLDLADTVIDEVVLSSIEIDNRLHGTAKRIDKFWYPREIYPELNGRLNPARTVGEQIEALNTDRQTLRLKALKKPEAVRDSAAKATNEASELEGDNLTIKNA